MTSLAFGFALLILVTAVIGGSLTDLASKGSVWAKRALFGIALVNLSAGTYVLIDTTRSSDEQARKISQIALDQQTAITKANELVTKLTNAQATSQKISSDLTTTSKTVDSVLGETQRSLEQLQTLGLVFRLKLPPADPEVAALTESLHQGIRNDPKEWLKVKRDPRLSVLYPRSMRNMPMTDGFLYTPESPVYPKSPTALGMLTQSFRVDFHFFRHRHKVGEFSSGNSPEPDLTIEFVEDRSQPTVHISRFLDTDDGKPLLYGLYSKVSRNDWRSNGEIVSVRDLMQSQVVAQPIFGIPTPDQAGAVKIDKHEIEEAGNIWKSLRIDSAILSTQDGRRWEFDVAHTKTLAVSGAPLFIGEFRHLLKPREPLR